MAPTNPALPPIHRATLLTPVGTQLVFTDGDRHAVIEALRGAFPEGVLAYCLLDERLDVIAEGTGNAVCSGVMRTLAAYVNVRRARGARGEPGRPARVEVKLIPDAESLARAINEVHDLPLLAGLN